jgi:exopolyphosphatase/pppGpp-phosphohydrolase
MQCTLVRMRNITFSADKDLIARARLIARAQHKTLNAAFREWLDQFAGSSGDARSFDALMKRMKHVDAGKHFNRDELDERKVLSR